MPPSSWAKRTGFRPKFSGETKVSNSGQIVAGTKPRDPDSQADLEAGLVRPAAAINGELESGKVPPVPASAEKELPVKRRRDSDGGAPKTSAANGQATAAVPPPPGRRPVRSEGVVDVLPQTVNDDGFVSRRSHMKYELRDTPGLGELYLVHLFVTVPIGLYGFQQYISMLGSLVLVPLVIVPAMGGSHEDTANVVSTVLFVSGVTTLLHTSFGSRLPLIQGPSFVYLAPALAIINSPEFLGLNGNNFKHIMKELQGAIIISSAFQAILGYSGLMTLLLRLINPVVVAPTIAAVGLSFYSYGFPRVGTCLEIGAVQILLVIIFSLYLRKISFFGYRVFLVYAVPLGLAITWAAAFLLSLKMKQCRVDTSQALKSSPWFRFPYPLQWGTPVFNWKMALFMCVVSLISSVDSVGSYHASSLLVASRPPTPGILSRGIGLEGLSAAEQLSWVHAFLIVLSLVGKVGGFIASIPEVMSAALLCFMWAMLAALAYFQQYGISPNTNLSVPSYLQPYIVASHGPFRTKYGGLNYVMNTLLSLHMVIAFLIAVVLDNTVPGSPQERGVYVWSEPRLHEESLLLPKTTGCPSEWGEFSDG
ncbi:nucleobase-ascorbate transporter 12 [Actinidia rufa]|uniref:Nucleobase-ascorbate transporter 12 n=1 Tax=Actinidia rufa TaxID=165716 RepID=A0A7J0GPE4_9ERIC|nr:nucleobase-ascorbate transporter 12 [Actinidia rufa]